MMVNSHRRSLWRPIRTVGLHILRKGWLLSIPSPIGPVARLVNDYGDTNRYSAENRRIPPPSATEHRVVFMGDSITDFWGRGELASTAPFFPGKPYLNRGISGQVTAQMLLRFYADVVALEPKAVVILAGINDIGGNVGPVSDDTLQNNVASMAAIARAHNIRVVLGSILPVSARYWGRDTQLAMSRISSMNQWLRSYSREADHVYIDYFAATADQRGFLRAGLTEDGLHPNAAGYALMTPLAEQAISIALRY